MKHWTEWHARAKTAKERSTKSDADLAVAISEVTKRKAGRAQVNHWFTGKREPTISQFMALCVELGADPGAILFEVPVLPASAGPKEIAEALSVDPTKAPSYAMQEKSLTMRRTPSRKPLAHKKRRPVTA